MSHSTSSATRPLRSVRSFVRRQGRLTAGQTRALELLWPQFGIDYGPAPINLTELFGNDHPITLEIGFGDGNSLAQMALAAPQRNFIGIEVHTPGVGHLLQQIEHHQLSNVRICHHDAVEVLREQIPDATLDRLQLFFPDPWHKKKHHKRRIVQREFLDRIAAKLKPGGIIHMATDWEPYAEQMLIELNEHSAFSNTISDGDYAPRPKERPLTKFEQRGHRLGHGVWDLLFRRQ